MQNKDCFGLWKKVYDEHTDIFSVDDMNVLTEVVFVCDMLWPEEGTLADIFGLRREINSCIDELTGIIQRANLKSKEDVVLVKDRVKWWHQRFNSDIEKMLEIEAYGIEEYIDENLDDDEQYYVKIDERDAELDKLHEKLKTLESMYPLAHSDTGYRLIQSAYKDVYGELFQKFYLREQVGFDKTQFNVDIVSIDMSHLIQAANDCRADNYSSLPRVIIERMNEEDITDDNQPLVLPVQDHNIKKIEVTLSHYVSFLFEKNNSNLLEEDGSRKSDIYLLKITVEPVLGYEYLGNLNNYSYEEMAYKVSSSIAELESLTGIVINSNNVRLNAVELNLTFMQKCDFTELMRSVSYFQLYTRKGYKTSEYKYSSSAYVETRKQREELGRMKCSGFTTANNSVALKLYDKGVETIGYAKSWNYDLRFEDKEHAIIRLEFSLRNRGQLRAYFGFREHEPVLFSRLSQERIEDTYKSLVNMFFVEAYEEGYVPDSIRTLKLIMQHIDTTKKGGKWKQELIREILSQEIWSKSTPALLSEDDIVGVLKYNDTFKKRPGHYSGLIMDLLRESEIFPKGQNVAYDNLFNFLNKTYNLKSLSKYRRIGYAAVEDEELPDLDDEVAVRLQARKMYITMMNMNNDDFVTDFSTFNN